VLVWEVIAKNPRLFKIAGEEIQLDGHKDPARQGPERVLEVVKKAHPYLEHLGVGGMGTRGMGRIKVIEPTGGPSAQAGGQP
jgi:CRISPR-associated protein Cmr4